MPGLLKMNKRDKRFYSIGAFFVMAGSFDIHSYSFNATITLSDTVETSWAKQGLQGVAQWWNVQLKQLPINQQQLKEEVTWASLRQFAGEEIRVGSEIMKITKPIIITGIRVSGLKVLSQGAHKEVKVLPLATLLGFSVLYYLCITKTYHYFEARRALNEFLYEKECQLNGALALHKHAPIRSLKL